MRHDRPTDQLEPAGRPIGLRGRSRLAASWWDSRPIPSRAHGSNCYLRLLASDRVALSKEAA